MFKFSRRTDWNNTLNPLAKKLADKRASGETLVDLTESNPTRCGFQYLRPDLLKPLIHPSARYYEPDPRGLLSARKAVAEYYSSLGATIDPEAIFLTASTSEAYGFLFQLLGDPGETLLTPAPSYPLFDYLARLSGLRLSPYPLVYEEKWGMDLEAFKALITKENPRAAIIVNPNNPTGHYAASAEREILIQWAEKNSAAIIADEVFLDFPFKAPGKTFAGEARALSFTLSGLSKIMGLPQMKLSWIALSGPENLRREAAHRLEIIADTYLSVNTPAQKALPAWLNARQVAIDEILARVRANRELLLKTVSHSLTLLEADGGWYAVLKLSDKISDEDFALGLLDKQSVLISPGYFFDFASENVIVISLLPSPEIFEEGLKRIRCHCEERSDEAI